MTLAAQKYFQFGTKVMQIAKRNSLGYPVGTVANPESVTANVEMHAYVLAGLRNFEPHQREIGKVTNRGDNKLRGAAYTGVKDYGEGTFELGEEDETFMAMITRSALDTTLSSAMVFRAGNDGEVDPENMFLMVTTRCQDEDGTKWYRTEVIYNAQVQQAKKPSANQNDGENPSPLQFKYTPNLSERGVTGHLLSATGLNVLEDEDTYCVIRSNKPLALTTWKANGTATDFDLFFKPTSSSATGAANNVVTLNGVTHTVTSVTPATGNVVIAAAGSSGDWWVVLYETDLHEVA